MIIQADRMFLGSTRKYESKTYVAQTVEAVSSTTDNSSGFSGSLKNIMTEFEKSQKTKSSSIADRLEAVRQMRNQTFQYFLELLFGKKSSLRSPDLADENTYSLEQNIAPNAISYQTTRYTSYFTYCEDETTSFSATGKVLTSDGRSIDFNMDLTLSRSFREQTSSFIDYTQPVLLDPLVINLDTASCNVTDQKFFFDLDADGTEEELSMLANGSGYLALDKNGDGIINDGRELFGTQSGNGFAELSMYDLDKNGWIDEADEIFEKLKIWTMDSDGSSKLLSLKESGVGAIYLGSAASDFSLKDSSNATAAIIRATGMFLYEDGRSGTMQQVDLAT